MKRIKKHYVFILLSLLYFASRLIYLRSDYNIFDPLELDLSASSVFIFFTKIISLLVPHNFRLLPARLVSILAGYLAGFSLYSYIYYKRLDYKYLILLLFWFSPFTYYYSRVGQPAMLGLSFLLSSNLLHSVHKNRLVTSLLFLFSILVCPYLALYIISFYLLITDKHVTILEQLTYLSLPTIILLIVNPYCAALIFTPILSIGIVYLFSSISVFIPIGIFISLLPLTFVAYQSTIHTSLLEMNDKLEALQNIYYTYDVYTTFNQKELSQFLDKDIKWLDQDLTQGGILIADDILSYDLSAKAKEKAFIVYQNKIPQSIQKYSFANSYSYFPAKYDKNTYRIYLILSDEDYRTIFGQFEN